jgi:hypothetical protein
MTHPMSEEKENVAYAQEEVRSHTCALGVRTGRHGRVVRREDEEDQE